MSESTRGSMDFIHADFPPSENATVEWNEDYSRATLTNHEKEKDISITQQEPHNPAPDDRGIVKLKYSTTGHAEPLEEQPVLEMNVVYEPHMDQPTFKLTCPKIDNEGHWYSHGRHADMRSREIKIRHTRDFSLIPITAYPTASTKNFFEHDWSDAEVRFLAFGTLPMTEFVPIVVLRMALEHFKRAKITQSWAHRNGGH